MLFTRLTLTPPLPNKSKSLSHTRTSPDHPPPPITVFNKYHHPTPNHSINHPEIVVSITPKDPPLSIGSPSKKKKKKKKKRKKNGKERRGKRRWDAVKKKGKRRERRRRGITARRTKMINYTARSERHVDLARSTWRQHAAARYLSAWFTSWLKPLTRRAAFPFHGYYSSD